MLQDTSKPFFVNPAGQHQKSLYHSTLSRQSSLMVKFKQIPFDSKYPRPGTPGKIVYMELHDGYEYIYQIENEGIVGQLEGVDLNEWYNLVASGKGDGATLALSLGSQSQMEVADQREERAAIQNEPPLEPQEPHAAPNEEPGAPLPVTPEPLAGRHPSTHIDCVAMTVETFKAFEAVGIGLDALAVSKIYNTHFIALSRRGLTR